MFVMTRFGRVVQCLAALAILLTLVPPPSAFCQPAGIDPQAEKLLRASTDFLAGLKRFSIDTRSTLEVVLVSGQKIQFDNVTRVSVQRPNKLRAERRGGWIDQVFYYDGQSFIRYHPGEKVYATIAAPGTLEEMLDFARTKLDLVAPASDLIYKNAYEILTEGATNGFIVGKGMVEGVRCDHLAFRAPHVDLQIWIQEGRRPLPRKMVITTKDVDHAPQFTVVMKQWNLAPKFTGSVFRFQPPKGVQRVEFVPVDSSKEAIR
jgi:hypothetical protein